MLADLKYFIAECRKQDLAFYCACAYLVFEYLRPHTIFPWLDFLPWAQLSLIVGLCALFIQKALRFQYTHFLVFLFSVVCVFSAASSEFSGDAFIKIDVPISWFVVVLIFSNSIRTLEQYRLVAVVFFILIFKMSLFGAKTWVSRGFGFTAWGIAGPRGWFENSGELALIMVVFTVMSFGFLIAQGVKRRIYYLAPLTGLMTIIAASSRGSQLAIAAVLLLAAVFVWRISFKNILAISILVVTAVYLFPEEQTQRFESMGSDATSESRLMYWGKGLEMLEENPFLGIGFNVFPQYFAVHYAPYIQFENFSYRQEVAHNTFIQVASELGYTGLIVYLAFLLQSTQLTRAARRKSEGSVECAWVGRYTAYMHLALIGYIIGSIFMSVALYPYIYLLLSLNQSLLNAVEKNVEGN